MFLDQSDRVAIPPEPTTTKELQAFTYTSLDPKTRSVVQQCTFEIKSLTKRTTGDTIQIGQSLTLVKQRLRHGQYGEWLRAEFDWSEQTARQFVHVAQWAKTTKIVDLSFDFTALYRLAAPRTPETARQEALQRARQGEFMTCSEAQKIIDRHKNPPILPEVLLPEPSTVSTQKQTSSPLITITIPAKAASSPKLSIEQRALVEAGTGLDAQEPLDVNPEYWELPERVIDENAAREANGYTQAVTGSKPQPPIKLISIDFDDSTLQQNPFQIFKVTSAGLHLRFESYLGDFVAWLQQQHLVFGEKAVRDAQLSTGNFGIKGSH